MGGGHWITDSWEAANAARRAAGYRTAFAHTEDIANGRKAARVHERLDPRSANRRGAHTGLNIREALDSDEHPDATPIAVLFDVTGSMGQIPRVLQTKLPQLHGLLQRKGYVSDPQILFGGIGDAYWDRGPLQIGQFESDNAMDDQLADIWLEGGGGGGGHESYELAAYFMARHTFLDSERRRGRKGYLFLIGDEQLYDRVNAEQVRNLIGGPSAELRKDIPVKKLFAELKERFHVFFLFAEQGSYSEAAVLDGRGGWRALLGQNALVLQDAEAVCETIALALGVMEGTVAIEEGIEDLREAGATPRAARAAGKALARVGATAMVPAKVAGELPPGAPDGDGWTGANVRLLGP
jgi:hypothetical protein